MARTWFQQIGYKAIRISASLAGTICFRVRWTGALGEHGRGISRMAGSYTRTAADREDLEQDIALAPWRALPTFPGESSLKSYMATVNGSTVTIYAPGSTSNTPATDQTGSMTISATAFARDNIPLANWRDTSVTPNQSSSTIPGENLRHTITPYITSYPYPGTTSKAMGRTDCSGTTCTYAEEMTNYATGTPITGPGCNC